MSQEPLDGTEQTNTVLGEAARDTYVPRQTERRTIADHQSMRQECAAESGTVAYLYQHEIGRGRLDLKAQLRETLSQQLARVLDHCASTCHVRFGLGLERGEPGA